MSIPIDQKKRTDQESPQFSHNFASIAASASFILAIEDVYPRVRKYPVMNWLEVVNNDVVNINVNVNGVKDYYIPAKNVRTIYIPNVRHIRIDNLDASTASTINRIRTIFSYKP